MGFEKSRFCWNVLYSRIKINSFVIKGQWITYFGLKTIFFIRFHNICNVSQQHTNQNNPQYVLGPFLESHLLELLFLLLYKEPKNK